MTEMMKTLIYVAVAGVTLLVAFVTRPRQEAFDVQEQVDKVLFADFNDPLTVTNLEIVTYDEEVGEPHTFRVAQDSKGRWSIPSHAGYPADADDQMRNAATALVGLRVLGIATEVESEHSLFGVVEPSDELDASAEGIGKMVSVEHEKGKAALIIGNEVPQAEGQHFVRIPGQPVVYDVKIDPAMFSTDFGEWINKDLLDLNGWDIKTVNLKDYSVVRTLNNFQVGFSLDRRSDTTVSFADNEWKVDEMLTYVKGEAQPTELLDYEELDATKLNDLKNALGDLEIVDVQAKPVGLGADLKLSEDAAQTLAQSEDADSLVSRGFYPVRLPGKSVPEILSANGEVHVWEDDAVEYILRFGSIATGTEGADKGALNRYLFITTRVDKSRIPMPDLEEVPQLPPQPQGPSAAPAGGEAAPPAATEAAPATEDDAAGDAGQVDDELESEADPDEAGEPADAPAAPDDAAPPAADTDTDQDTDIDQDTDTEQETDTDTAPDTDEDAEANQDAAVEAAEKEASEPQVDAEEKRAELEAEIERITKENQRKIDERDEKIKKAQEKVNKLNSRFADWYYVISEDVYKKIHLSRGDIIKEDEDAKKEGSNVDAFRSLQDAGLETENE